MLQVWLSRLRFALSCRKAITVHWYRSLSGLAQRALLVRDSSLQKAMRSPTILSENLIVSSFKETAAVRKSCAEFTAPIGGSDRNM